MMSPALLQCHQPEINGLPVAPVYINTYFDLFAVCVIAHFLGILLLQAVWGQGEQVQFRTVYPGTLNPSGRRNKVTCYTRPSSVLPGEINGAKINPGTSESLSASVQHWSWQIWGELGRARGLAETLSSACQVTDSPSQVRHLHPESAEAETPVVACSLTQASLQLSVDTTRNNPPLPYFA